MAPYEEWNRIDEDDDDELQDSSFFEGKKDVILFAIDCSESMFGLRDDPSYEGDVKTCHILTALEAAVQIQKKKVIVGPNDSVGIMFFNTTRRNESSGQGSEIKRGNFIFQPISIINAPKVQELSGLVESARQDPTLLKDTFPPIVGSRVPMGDVFTSCNWIMRDGAPKTATKRIFLITDEDDPNRASGSDRLLTSAKTTLIDLTQAGITVEPFFISTEEKLFDVTKFYSSVLLSTNIADDEDDTPGVLPESVSITRIDDLLDQMRFHEVAKRAQFSIPFQLAEGFTIGVKGYGLVTEQRKGGYKYFIDRGEGMEVVNSRTDWVDKTSGLSVKKDNMVYGMSLGDTSKAETVDEGGDDDDGTKETSVARAVPLNAKVFYTAEEVKAFRTLGLEPHIRLLGFKPRKSLKFKDNVKHSTFIYPDELTYSGSKRTFSALVQTMIRKKRIGLVLALTRRNATPTFCALVPQAEKAEEGGWVEPAGFHLIPLPFADDIRAAPEQVLMNATASDALVKLATAWVSKLTVKHGAYPLDSYLNPALAYHNAQLEASAFREEFDPESFEDLSEPNRAALCKKVGEQVQAWKHALSEDETANTVAIPSGPTKRKADTSVDEVELRSRYEEGTMSKYRVDQLKEFLKSKGLSVSGKKADLMDRVEEYFTSHPR